MNSSHGYLRAGQWKKIPLFFHWTILLWVPWCAFQGKTTLWVALSLPAFVALLAAHEFGHAIAARRKRVKVTAIKLYLLHGLCEHEEPYYESDHVFIAWGGVAAQVVVLLLALPLDYLTTLALPELRFIFAPWFYVLINANCMIAAFNLLPIPPLDGYVAWRAIPLLKNAYFPLLRVRWRTLKNMLNFRKRREMVKESEKLAEALIDRLKNK